MLFISIFSHIKIQKPLIIFIDEANKYVTRLIKNKSFLLKEFDFYILGFKNDKNMLGNFHNLKSTSGNIYHFSEQEKDQIRLFKDLFI